MKNLFFTVTLFISTVSSAGTSFGTGSTSSTISNHGGLLGNGKTGGLVSLEGLLKKNSRAQVLAVEQDRIDGLVVFQTATPIKVMIKTNDTSKLIEEATEAPQVHVKWDIKTWQGSEAKIQALPELQNALEYSRTIRNWQQLK